MEIQRYYCTNCNKSYSSERGPIKLQKAIFNDYFNHRYTLHELAQNIITQESGYKIKFISLFLMVMREKQEL